MPFICYKYPFVYPFVGYGKPLIFANRRTFTSPAKTPGSQRGFTMIELFITVLVLAIILAIATPNLRDLLQRNKLVAQTNDLVADLNLARNSAISQGERIVICASSNADSATPTCGNNWSAGWIIFSDCEANDGNPRLSTNVCPGPTGANQLPERVLKAHTGIEASTSVAETQNSGAINRLRYSGIGMLVTTGTEHIIRVCATGIADGRRISVNALGRPLVSVWASTEANSCP